MGISAPGEDAITAKRAEGGCSLGVPVLYIILGLDRRANEDDIHSSYHRLAAAHRSGGIQDRALASRRLRVLAEAYAVLGDPARRALYDAQLSTVARQPVQPASALPDTRGALRSRRPPHHRRPRPTFRRRRNGRIGTRCVPRSSPHCWPWRRSAWQSKRGTRGLPRRRPILRQVPASRGPRPRRFPVPGAWPRSPGQCDRPACRWRGR